MAKRRTAKKAEAPRNQKEHRYGPGVKKFVEKEMHKYKEGRAKSGSGQPVRSSEQAVAIALSEARRAGEKVPPDPHEKGKSA